MAADLRAHRVLVVGVVLLLGTAAQAGDPTQATAAAPIVASWTLKTDDTQLTIAVGKDQQMK